jgi:hypothetical protein|tara:strand:- start:3294 stop:3518 length:225 start_codon:yes stop_codon:yes gene_type:complete
LAVPPFGIQSAELDAPESDGLVADRNTPLGQEIFNIPIAEIESEVEPDSIRNDIWRESLALIRIHPTILSIWAS